MKCRLSWQANAHIPWLHTLTQSLHFQLTQQDSPSSLPLTTAPYDSGTYLDRMHVSKKYLVIERRRTRVFSLSISTRHCHSWQAQVPTVSSNSTHLNNSVCLSSGYQLCTCLYGHVCVSIYLNIPLLQYFFLVSRSVLWNCHYLLHLSAFALILEDRWADSVYGLHCWTTCRTYAAFSSFSRYTCFSASIVSCINGSSLMRNYHQSCMIWNSEIGRRLGLKNKLIPSGYKCYWYIDEWEVVC